MSRDNLYYIASVTEFIVAIERARNQSGKNITLEEYMQTQLSSLRAESIERGEAYVGALLRAQSKDKLHENPHWFYRGHYSSDYLLIPSVFRGRNWGRENYYYHEMGVRSPEHFQGKTHLDKLVTMQHYDCPTRLLDITSNPLVALFFACMNYGCPKCDKSTGGSVYIFSQLSHNVVYSDSDRALMLSCLASMSREEKEELYTISMMNLEKDSFVQVKGGSRYRDEVVEKLYHEITRESPAFKREIRPIDLLQPLFIQPNKTNTRIAKQDGAFILCGLSKDADEAKEKIELNVYQEIRIENQSEIIRQLDQLGINEASLFPELDKVAHYLKTKL